MEAHSITHMAACACARCLRMRECGITEPVVEIVFTEPVSRIFIGVGGCSSVGAYGNAEK